jgi:hypothetical protein
MPGMLPDDLSVPFQGPTLGWGHMIGALALPGRRRVAADLLLRAELEDLLTNLCWALDERRRDLLLDLLAERFIWRGSIDGSHELGPVEGRDAFIEWQHRIWDADAGEQPRHLLLNTIHGGDPAYAPTTSSYVLLVTNRAEAHRSIASGFVTASYRWEDGGWRIASVFTGWDLPPWRRKLTEMTSRERRLRLVREKGIDD